MNQRNRVLVAGAINTDLVAQMERAPEAGETVTGTAFSVHAGGKGGNQAVAVARSGVPVAILGAIGADDFGTGRLDDLRADRVETRWVTVKENESSGVAMIFVERGGENRIAYVPGATLLVTPEDAERAVSEAAPTAILSTNELPPETLAALFKAAVNRSVSVVLNATPDPGKARLLLTFVDILVVNEGEARALAGVPDGVGAESVIEALQRLGPNGIVVTLGGDGVIGSENGQRFRHRSPQVEAVDTTGAGDTFCGALMAKMMEGEDLSEAARYGVHAGALAVTKVGAQPSIPNADAIRTFMTAESATQSG